MGDGALGSDHVNYLVLRYLQESGFENAAKSLYRDWYRNDEYRDPEEFPFAPAVKQHELVHIIQDGLFHDQLQASIANGKRRFHLTSTDPEFAVPRAKSISRRQSLFAATEREDFAIPPAKRVRQSNASEPVTNGDAMDIDERAAEEDDRTSAHSEQDQAQSEQDPMEQTIIETKTMGTQTDKKKTLKAEAAYWTIDKSMPVTILHIHWGPGPTSSGFILAAGESLCRLYDVDTAESDRRDISSLDAVPMSPDHTVTATAWHPSGQHVTCAIQCPPKINGTTQYKMQLLDITTSGERRYHDDAPEMVAIALRFSKSGNVLFTASSDGRRSVLEARAITPHPHKLQPAVTSFVEDNVIVDLAPLSDTSFAVCGRGLVAVWSVEESALVQTLTHAVPADVSYDKIRYDWRHQVLLAISTSSGQVCSLARRGAEWTDGPELILPSDATRIAAVCFEPAMSDQDSDSPSHLAISLLNDEGGKVCLYHVTSGSIDLGNTLEIGQQEPPLALAWAPGDVGTALKTSRLAAASDEAIRMWDVSTEPAQDLLFWKAAPANWYQGDDNHLPDDEDATEPSLSWSARGDKLAFAVGRKMAIVSISEEAHTNGINGTAAER